MEFWIHQNAVIAIVAATAIIAVVRALVSRAPKRKAS